MLSEKATKILEKLRKGSSTGLTAKLLPEVLEGLGWELRTVATLARPDRWGFQRSRRWNENWEGPQMRPDFISNPMESLVEEIQGNTIEPVKIERGVPVVAFVPVVGVTYYHDVVAGGVDVEGKPYIRAMVWEGVERLEIKNKAGDKFHTDKDLYWFHHWAMAHGIQEAAARALGLPTVEEEKAAKAKAKHNAKPGKTCPVCERKHQLHNDRMVHHGYQRPGDGSGIIGDCFGVGYLPYEVSDEGCHAFKAVLLRKQENVQEFLARLRSGQVKSLLLNEGTIKNPKLVTVSVGDPKFQAELKSAIFEKEAEIESIKYLVSRMDELIRDWKKQ